MLAGTPPGADQGYIETVIRTVAKERAAWQDQKTTGGGYAF
jgi:hypothetical protein